MGYAGGETENPTYRKIGDHTETIQVDYDPSEINYEELLQLFWSGHNAAATSYSRQYMSLIFYHDEAQKELALASKQAVEVEIGEEVYTEILSIETFYLAEDYHQKYFLQAEPRLSMEIKAYYADFTGFIDSTVAARLNGYAGGYRDEALLVEELEAYGLSTGGRERLLRMAR